VYRKCKREGCGKTCDSPRKFYCSKRCQASSNRENVKIRAAEKRRLKKIKQITDDQVNLSKMWPKTGDHAIAGVLTDVPRKRAREAAYRLWKAREEIKKRVQSEGESP